MVWCWGADRSLGDNDLLHIMTATSGHYVCWARSSNATDLDLEESSSCRWFLYDDTKRVEASTFQSINQALASHTSNSVYMLWYKRIKNDDGGSVGSPQDHEALYPRPFVPEAIRTQLAERMSAAAAQLAPTQWQLQRFCDTRAFAVPNRS